MSTHRKRLRGPPLHYAAVSSKINALENNSGGG